MFRIVVAYSILLSQIYNVICKHMCSSYTQEHQNCVNYRFLAISAAYRTLYSGNSHDNLMHILIVFPLQVCLLLTYIYICLQREASFNCDAAEFGMDYGYVLDAPHLLAGTRLDYIPLDHYFTAGNIPVLSQVSCINTTSSHYGARKIATHKTHVETNTLHPYLSRLTILLGA